MIDKKALFDRKAFSKIIGQDFAKSSLASALLAGRHVLLVGPPGTGKTTLAKAVAALLPTGKFRACGFNCLPERPVCPKCRAGGPAKLVSKTGEERFVRLQGSPDLTVEDIFGEIDPIKALKFGPTSVQAFTPGKIFTANNGVLFFDELNRCPEKLQNALLQALDEHKVTLGPYTIDFPAQFIFIGTLNPEESAATEKLSDVLLDRLDIVRTGYPESEEIEEQIVLSAGKAFVEFPKPLLAAAIAFVRQLRECDQLSKKPSVRASIGIYERAQASCLLEGCSRVQLRHIESALLSVLEPRIGLKPSLRWTTDIKEWLLDAYNKFRQGREIAEESPEEIDARSGKFLSAALAAGLRTISAEVLCERLFKSPSSVCDLLAILLDRDAGWLAQAAALPEVRAQLQLEIKAAFAQLKGIENGQVTKAGLKLIAAALLREELERLRLIGFSPGKERAESGERAEARPWRRESYRALALRPTLRQIAKGQQLPKCLRVWTKLGQQRATIVLALDASASMRGKKIEMCKRAGIALALATLEAKGRIGLAAFASDVKVAVSPTDKLEGILDGIAGLCPSGLTNLAGVIAAASEMLDRAEKIKHIALISDALPTLGKEPELETLKAAAAAASQGVSISVIGIGLGPGRQLAEKITQIANGRLYAAQEDELENLDILLLKDWAALQEKF